MNKRLSITMIAVPALIAGGIALALLPAGWIEMRLGFSPDGGNGLAEFLCAAVLMGAAVALAVINAGRSARGHVAGGYANFASAAMKAAWFFQRIW